MEFVERFLDDLIKREGGYVNNPNDKGGETCWGITVAVARANGYAGPMRNMPQSIARDIYRRQYWTAPGYDKVAERSKLIAEELFDTGVNMGVGIPGKWLQRCLNVLNLGHDGAPRYADLLADGDIGGKTLAALDAYLKMRGKAGEIVMLKALNCLQGARYIELAEGRVKNEAFVYGWLEHRVGVPNHAA